MTIRTASGEDVPPIRRTGMVSAAYAPPGVRSAITAWYSAWTLGMAATCDCRRRWSIAAQVPEPPQKSTNRSAASSCLPDMTASAKRLAMVLIW